MSRGHTGGVRWPGREAGAIIPAAESQRRSAAQREAQNRPDVRAKVSAGAKAAWDNPAARARRMDGIRKALERKKAASPSPQSAT